MSPYDTAWEHLDDKDKRLLCKGTPIGTLFQQLDEADRRQQAKEWLQLGRMRVGIEYIQNACEVVDLFADFIPAPGIDAALGLIKGTLTVCFID